MNIFKYFSELFNNKSLSSKSCGSIDSLEYNHATNAYKQIKEGYCWNAIVYSCVSKIAQACGELELESVDKKGEYVEAETEILKLIQNPNQFQNDNTFIESAIIYHQLTGSCFIEGVMSGNRMIELNVIPTHEVTIQSYNTNNAYQPIEYTWNSNGLMKTWRLNQILGIYETEQKNSRLLHIKNFNPLLPKEGLSPLSAGAYAVDGNNLGMEWNNSMLNNYAKPSGVLSTEKVFDAPQRSFIAKYLDGLSGSKNANKTMILEGGLNWAQTGLSPLDMDFSNTLDKTAKYIAMVFKIPLDMVLGNSTYANLSESREMFYIDTVIPLTNRFLKELSKFIDPKGIYRLRVNMDNIIALEGMRERLFNRNVKGVQGSILTPNEARESIGYDPVDGIGDDLLTSGNTKLLDDVGAEIVNELQSLNTAQRVNNQKE